MGEAVPITNTLFPPPPGFFRAFTDANISRLAELEGRKSPSADGAEDEDGDITMGKTAGDEKLNEVELKELEELRDKLRKPIAEWVTEDGRWMVFGQMYTTEILIPTAESIGLPPFLTSDPNDPDQNQSARDGLTRLLHSFLHTLVKLIDVLTGTARMPGELEEAGRASEGDQHLSNLAATMMVTVNQLRGVQAESTLVLLLEKQLAERKEQTVALRAKCAQVAEDLRQLKAASRAPL